VLRRAVVAILALVLTIGPAPLGEPRPALATTDPCAGAPRAPYVDVGDGSRYAWAVDCLHGLRAIQGLRVDEFVPAAAMTRDRFAGVVAGAIRASGVRLPPGDPDQFRDITGNPHRRAIEQLATAGILPGLAPGEFRPGGRISRGMVATVLARAHRRATGTVTRGAPDAFRDDDGTRHEANIDRAHHLRLVTGVTTDRYDPTGILRRDVAADVGARLYRVLSAHRGTAPPPWGYATRTSTIPASLRATMTGTSWHRGCPVGFADLRLIELVFRDMRGRDRVGLLVVHRGVAGDVRDSFRRAHAEGFAVRRMHLIDRYSGDDDTSMRKNNTSAFNCRRIADTRTWSEHAYGRAIDVNPVQNPYVRGSTVEPTAGREYLDRSDVRPGMLTGRDPIVRTFESRGWGWGGRWSSFKDYQHLSSTGR
jgi:hypothetical protein